MKKVTNINETLKYIYRLLLKCNEIPGVYGMPNVALCDIFIYFYSILFIAVVYCYTCIQSLFIAIAYFYLNSISVRLYFSFLLTTKET